MVPRLTPSRKKRGGRRCCRLRPASVGPLRGPDPSGQRTAAVVERPLVLFLFFFFGLVPSIRLVRSFDFGFGWSHAGFSNILTFYETCNIPDWVVKEAGDPETEADKLLDRSPISHVERLEAPILLTHGSNDWRVPPDESRRFVEKAEALGKPVTYVEFEGQGHGIRGFENLVRYYQAVLDFYADVSEGNRAAS